jgi:Mg-chelatase subunit ChlD
MKDRLPLNEDMEVMLTSYLLGELGDSDVRRVELALKENPELRAIAKELEASICVLRQATAVDPDEGETKQHIPQKLSTDRRNDLIASLREHDVSRPKSMRQLPWFIPMGIAAGLIALLSAYSFMLQTQSSMKDAIGAAERMIVYSDSSRIETTELFSNFMTPAENEARKSAPVDKFRFFQDPALEQNRGFRSQESAVAEEVDDTKRNSQTALSFGLANEFVQPPTIAEAKKRSRFESKNESLERVLEKAQKPIAPTTLTRSFGRSPRSKTLQKSEAPAGGIAAVDAKGSTMLGAIESVQEDQLDLVTSFASDLSVSDSVELKALPALKSLKEADDLQDAFTVIETAREADTKWGAGDHIAAIQPAPDSDGGMEGLAKRRPMKRWAYQELEDEALFGSGRESQESLALSGKPESIEKRVSPGPQSRAAGARFGMNRAGNGKKANPEDLGFSEAPPKGEIAGDVSHRLYAIQSDAASLFDDSLATETLSNATVDFSGSMEGFSGGLGGGGLGGGMEMLGLSAGSQLAVQSDDLDLALEGEAQGLSVDAYHEDVRNVTLDFESRETDFDVRGGVSAETQYFSSHFGENEVLGNTIADGLQDSGIAPQEPGAMDADDFLSYGFQPASPSFGAIRPAIVADASPKPENNETWDLAEEAPIQKTYRGRMLGEELLGEWEKSKSFQRESKSAVPSLGKEVATRSAGRFRNETHLLGDIDDLHEIQELSGPRHNVIREEQVMLQRLQQDVSSLQQLSESVLSQAPSPSQSTANSSVPSTVSSLGRKLVEDREAKGVSSVSQPAQPFKPIAASNVDHRPELETAQESTSTFSLNVSDVSFKLAKAALDEGQLPGPESIRSEQFLNAFDYRDPAPYSNQPIGFYSEQAQHPFAHHRDVLRFALQTAASGRASERPMHLTILLDNSGSMERSDRREILSQALNVLSQKLTTKDRISVVSFARTARLWVDGAEGGSPVAILEKVNNLMPQGGTNIEEALNVAYEVASDHYVKDGINRVVLLTDGAANLGNVDPDVLKQKVVKERKRGIAFDCFGIGWDGLNDPLLEVLSRNGDGRYGFLNNPSDASSEFADQLAGSLNVAASDVKVQVEFNPNRVKLWRQVGYAKHQLTKEQFRDNTVDAAEIAAAESGNALYVIEPIESGSGPIGQVRVRYRVPHTSEYREKEWTVPYKSNVPAVEDSSASMKLALASGLFAEWLNGNPHAGSISLDALRNIYRGVPETFGEDPRPYELQQMFEQAREVSEL